jgi:hypothetical protein
MQFFKAFVSTLLVAAPMAMAAPSESGLQLPNTPEVDALIAELVTLIGDAEVPEVEAAVEARDLEGRQGWTCAFLGGNKGCQVKVRLDPASLAFAVPKNSQLTCLSSIVLPPRPWWRLLQLQEVSPRSDSRILPRDTQILMKTSSVCYCH